MDLPKARLLKHNFPVHGQIPAESEISRQNRATPPQIKVSYLSPDPLVALSSHSQQVGGPTGGGYRGTFGFQKRDRDQGGVAATVTPVALLCATKPFEQSLSSAAPVPLPQVEKRDAQHNFLQNTHTHTYRDFWGAPRGPKDLKISRFRARLTIASENEIFERAPHRGPIFWGGGGGESSRRDWNFERD